MNSIRAKVVCILRNAERMLLIRIVDPHDGRCFLIPPGGGVEFGESLERAVLREILEEVGLRLPMVKRIAMFENMFQYAGRPEHELVFVYEADCHDPEVCSAEEQIITESDGAKHPARWYTIADVAATGLPLFPAGLLRLLSDREVAG